MSQQNGTSRRRASIRAQRKMEKTGKSGGAKMTVSCDVDDLRRQTMDALASGVNHLELDLTCVDNVDAGLLKCLVDVVREARSSHAALKVTPSLALDRFLKVCRLDERLQPVSSYAA